MERVAREIHILKLVQHPHIIQLYEIIETPRQLQQGLSTARNVHLFELFKLYLASKRSFAAMKSLEIELSEVPHHGVLPRRRAV